MLLGEVKSTHGKYLAEPGTQWVLYECQLLPLSEGERWAIDCSHLPGPKNINIIIIIITTTTTTIIATVNVVQFMFMGLL